MEKLYSAMKNILKATKRESPSQPRIPRVGGVIIAETFNNRRGILVCADTKLNDMKGHVTYTRHLKILKHGKKVLGGAGNYAQVMAVRRELQKYSLTRTMAETAEYVRSVFSRHCVSNKETRDAEFVLCGFEDGKSVIYQISAAARNNDIVLCEDFAVIGTGSFYAEPLMELYAKESTTRTACLNKIIEAIMEAVVFDSSYCGGSIEAVEISPGGCSDIETLVDRDKLFKLWSSRAGMIYDDSLNQQKLFSELLQILDDCLPTKHL